MVRIGKELSTFRIHDSPCFYEGAIFVVVIHEGASILIIQDSPDLTTCFRVVMHIIYSEDESSREHIPDRDTC